MKSIVYFSAQNTTGSSASIVSRLKEKLVIPMAYQNIMEHPASELLREYDHIIFIIATYGDQELQDDFEKFLLSLEQPWEEKKFSICELGNYYGYEDFSTGAGKIVESFLKEKKGTKLMP